MFALASFVLLLLSCTCSLALNCSQLEKLHHGNDGQVRETGRGDKFDDFDWALSKELNAEEPGNIVISPISLKVVLAMLYEGARDGTAHEIAAALDLDINNITSRRSTSRQRFSTILKSLQTSQGQYKIKMGTHVFIDNKAVPKELYQCKIQHYYNSALQAVDFSNSSAAVKTINSWASNATEGHIKDLLSEADAKASTIMLLLNAVYFKGQWEVPFPENKTKDGSFHLDRSKTVEVPMMEVVDKFGYINMTDIGGEMIRLPYLGNKFSMYVLLPYRDTDLNKVASALGPDRPIIDYIHNMSLATVNLFLPKFEYDYTKSLKPALEKLGIKTMFTGKAQLPDIAESSHNLVVTDILQKAGISVTEVGTVAYVATVAELADKFGGSDDENITVKVDRPFLFFIQDESTRTTVFVGKVTNPEKVKVETDQGVSTTPPATPSKDPETTPAVDDKFGGEQDSNTARFNYFDADLLEKTSAAENGNFVVSPASVKALLALLLEAADGTTRDELREVMRLPYKETEARAILSTLHKALQPSTSDKVVIESVARVFLSNKLTPNASYTSSLKDLYLADIATEDFAYPRLATKNINQWISSRTGGFIPNLIEEDMITPDTFSILTSAIYFEGKWKNEFRPENTKPRCFYSEPSLTCQQVPVMAKTEELFYKLDPTLDAHVVSIPYQDERFAMVIVLPRKREGMKRLSLDVDRLTLPELLNNMSLFEVNLKMPRFTVEFGAELISILKQMGLTELFSDTAKLPYMINNKMGKVGAIVHKAKIEVSEKGTRAAAASGASVVPLMYGLDQVNLEVDHPFYYFITERKSQAVLFSGRLSTMSGVTDPPTVPLASYSAQQGDTYDWEQNVGGSLPESDQEPVRAPSSGQAENHRYSPTTTTPKRYNKEAIHFAETIASAINKHYLEYQKLNNMRPAW